MCTLGILYFAKLFSPGQEYGMHKSIYTIYFFKNLQFFYSLKLEKKFAGKPQFALKKK
jgi:hypothetical protein